MRKRALLPSLSNLAVYPRLTARKVPLSASTAFPILVLQVTHFTIIRSSRNFPQLPSGVCQATKARRSNISSNTHKCLVVQA